MDTTELLKRLEDLVKTYERTQELELRKAELAAQTAHTILVENRKSQIELLTLFNKFLGSNHKISSSIDEDTNV